MSFAEVKGTRSGQLAEVNGTRSEHASCFKKVENVQIFSSAYFIWAEEVFVLFRFGFGFELRVLSAQPFWFALYQ